MRLLFLRIKETINNFLMEDVGKRKLKSYWVEDGGDYVCNLGIMSQAVKVKIFSDNGERYYSIGHSSYFPFYKEQYNLRFDNYFDCCELAENHIMNWLRSIMTDAFPLDVLLVDGEAQKQIA